MPLTDYRLITFTCFGTLIDRDSGVVAALRPLVARGGASLARDAVLAAFHRQEAAALDDPESHSYADSLRETHRRLARDWGVACPGEEHELFARSIADWPAYPDAAGSLQYLKRYFRLGVLSHADRDSLRAASRRLDVQFDALWSAEDVGSFKPDRRNFDFMQARLGRLGVQPRQSLHVAASLPHDLLPAAASGLACAWIDRDGARPGAGPAGPPGARVDYAFRSVAHLVRAHQEHLRA
jgi:2-haloalkanoic acid dehalogenase type II